MTGELQVDRICISFVPVKSSSEAAWQASLVPIRPHTRPSRDRARGRLVVTSNKKKLI